MALLKWELRKLWRPGILGAILALGAVYYWMFPLFSIEHFCNGPNAQAEFDLLAAWVEEYGPTLEPWEREELDSRLAEEIANFETQLSAIPAAADGGLTSYEGVVALQQDRLSEREDSRALLERVYRDTNWYAVQNMETLLAAYDAKGEYQAMVAGEYWAWGYPEAMAARMEELAANSESVSLLPFSVKDSTEAYGEDLAVWCVLSVVLLLSPTLVRDRLRGTRPMQWTSIRGRKVLDVQMAAALLSALGLTAINVTAYALPFLAQGPLRFAACGLDGLSGWGIPWVDWSYGTYLLALAGLLLALSVGAAGLTVFLSQYSGNYVAMLLKALPLFVGVGAVAGSWLLDQPFHFRPLWDGVGPWVPEGAEFWVATALLILGLGLCACSCRRQKKRELL